MSAFSSTAEAYRKARERRSVAETFEDDLLHSAIRDAQEAEMSVRETAVALSVSKSTIARHWREGHRCAGTVPTWGSETSWQEAHTAIWGPDPQELSDNFIPWKWNELDSGSREVRRRSLGIARLHDDKE